MNVLLTFDIEIWCNSWETLSEDFPASFERYVYGRSSAGEFALPKTLEILDRHGLKGVFFVEPLFAARFGVEHLATVVDLIRSAEQEIQLHLHPEWTDEAAPPLLADVPGKRQHLSYYTREEQRQLVAHGLRLLQEAGAPAPTAFRAGSFACNGDTFRAIADNGLLFDSSINPALAVSQPGEVRDARAGHGEPFAFEGLGIYPMSVFRDGFGRWRHAQIGACSVRELAEALHDAREKDWETFVLLSHNFELMVPDKSEPDRTVVERFERICDFLNDQQDVMPTCGFGELAAPRTPRGLPMPSAGIVATSVRHAEQALRRLHR